MTQINIQKFEKLEAKATKPPWKRERHSINVVTFKGGNITVSHETHPDDAMDRDVLESLQADTDLIATMRNVFPQLLAEIQAHRESAKLYQMSKLRAAMIEREREITYLRGLLEAQ